MKQFNKSVYIIGIILIFTPLIVYGLFFCRQNISDNTETWGHFGDYLNGTFMPIIALVGIIATWSLGLISEKRNHTMIKIEQQKQRPLLHISYYDSEDLVRVDIVNKGRGPLVITDYKLVNLHSQAEETSIFDILPNTERPFNNYTGNQNNLVLSPDKKANLLLLKRNKHDNLNLFEQARDDTREAIADYKIVVSYKDVYENEMPTYEKSLAWFGRH